MALDAGSVGSHDELETTTEQLKWSMVGKLGLEELNRIG